MVLPRQAYSFQLPTVGLNLWHICLDILHILDLGIAQEICGSVIYMLVFDAGLLGSVDAKIGKVWDALVMAYRALGAPASERYSHVDFLGIFEGSCTAFPTRYPTLSFKGAICRHHVPALEYAVKHLDVWASGSAADLAHFPFIQELLMSLSRFIHVHPCHSVGAMWFEGRWWVQGADGRWYTWVYQRLRSGGAGWRWVLYEDWRALAGA